jgi:hypothetical protein
MVGGLLWGQIIEDVMSNFSATSQASGRGTRRGRAGDNWPLGLVTPRKYPRGEGAGCWRLVVVKLLGGLGEQLLESLAAYKIGAV